LIFRLIFALALPVFLSGTALAAGVCRGPAASAVPLTKTARANINPKINKRLWPGD